MAELATDEHGQKLTPLEKITKIAHTFPEVVREMKREHASFSVRKKIFAYFLNNHHGDGIVSICAKTLPGDHTALVAADPHRFYLPAYIGPRGWVGLRLDRETIDWEEVEELLKGSYLLTAPKSVKAKMAAKKPRGSRGAGRG